MMEAMNQGGWIMWILLAFLVISGMVGLERLFFWLRFCKHKACSDWEEAISVLAKGDQSQVEDMVFDKRDLRMRSLYWILQHRTPQLMSRSSELVTMACERAFGAMMRFLSFTETIVTMAPLFGILGTVLGIIQSFMVLHGRQAAHTELIGGLAQALLTTAAGLIVALLALAIHTVFTKIAQRQIQHLKHELSRALLYLTPNDEKLLMQAHGSEDDESLDSQAAEAPQDRQAHQSAQATGARVA